MARRRLDQLLVKRGLVSSRAQAQELIVSGAVYVRGFPQKKASTQIDEDAPLALQAVERQWVSRGAYKLLQGLDIFSVDVQDRVCLDVGASTGGFTEVLLDRGARRVYAVDVGYGQLAWKLREDPRVIVMERTNARYLTTASLEEEMGIVVSDASFISLRLLLPALERIGSHECHWILLVKPQFEAGKGRVGKGIIRDRALHLALLEELAGFVSRETRLVLIGATYSPVQGPKGNIEFLFHLKREGQPLSTETLGTVVDEAHAFFKSGNHSSEGELP